MGKIILLSNGLECLVDDLDYEDLNAYKWHARKPHSNTTTVYAFRSKPIPGIKYKNGKTKRTMVQMHRHLLNAPRNLDVDHIDGNGLNNTRENLRLATKFQNIANSKLNKRNTSGFKGVSRSGSAWRARINVHGKEISLGAHTTVEKAAKAYDAAARKYFGEFARLNYP